MIDLTKEMDKKVAEKAPELISLRKCAGVSLKKAKLEDQKANVALVLDISASMSNHYRSGLMQKVTEKILALASHMDSDGAIDIFFFGKGAYYVGQCTLDNYKTFLSKKLNMYGLEGSTRYANVVDLVRRFYYDDTLPEKYKQGSKINKVKRGLFLKRETEVLEKHEYSVFETYNKKPKKVTKDSLPTFVIFQTDGEAMDANLAREGFVASTYEPIFWFQVGLGNGPFRLLEQIDEGIKGALVDNASLTTTTAKHLNTAPDSWIYDEIAKEFRDYPSLIKKHGMLN